MYFRELCRDALPAMAARHKQETSQRMQSAVRPAMVALLRILLPARVLSLAGALFGAYTSSGLVCQRV